MKNKGFSLVELIVVIAIMAILVGVAVPVYTSYIQDAKDSVNDQYIASLESALNTAWVDAQAGLTDATGTPLNSKDGKITVVVTAGNVVVTQDGDDSTDITGTLLEAIFVGLIDLDEENTTPYTFVMAKDGNTFSYDAE